MNKNVTIIHSSTRHSNLLSNLSNTQILCIPGDESRKILETNKLNQFIDFFVFEPTPRMIEPVDTLYLEKSFELKKITFIDHYFDSPLTLALQTAIELKSHQVFLVGFDGYEQLNSTKDILLHKENQSILDQFLFHNSNLHFLTPSSYSNISKRSIFSLLS